MMTRDDPAPADPPKAKRLDLNLLQVFDMVMIERNVTRASRRLGLTQPAVSNAINRLRTLFEDALFNKTAKGVEPTLRAVSLWPQVHEAILKLNRAVTPGIFDPTSASTNFRMSIADFASALVTPALHRLMMKEAPHVALTFVPHVPELATERLSRGAVDFAISIDQPRSSALDWKPIWEEHYVVAGRKDHPNLQSPFDIAMLATAPLLTVNPSGSPDYHSPIDIAFAERGITRRVMLTVNHFMVASRVLADSELLAVLPSRLVRADLGFEKLACQPLPFAVSPLVLHLIWHRRNNGDPAMEWLKALIIAAFAHVDHAAAEDS